MYDLSQNLWGSDGNNNVAKSSKRINVTSKVKKSKKSGLGNGNVNMDFEVEPKMVQPVRSWRGPEQLGSMGLMVTDEGIMSKGLELLTGAKKAEMEEKWKELKVQELEHFVRKDNGVSPGPSDESTEENDEDDDEAAAGPDSEFMVQEKAQNQIQKKMNPHAVNHLSFKAKSVVTLAVSNSLALTKIAYALAEPNSLVCHKEPVKKTLQGLKRSILERVIAYIQMQLSRFGHCVFLCAFESLFTGGFVSSLAHFLTFVYENVERSKVRVTMTQVKR
ncbi:hypothetical protein Tco_0755801 [Tanacetum coccineum]